MELLFFIFLPFLLHLVSKKIVKQIHFNFFFSLTVICFVFSRCLTLSRRFSELFTSDRKNQKQKSQQKFDQLQNLNKMSSLIFDLHLLLILKEIQLSKHFSELESGFKYDCLSIFHKYVQVVMFF